MPPNNYPELGEEGETRESSTIEAGRRLAQAPPGEDVVISGLSGMFPESDNVYQFRDNLMSKIDMVTEGHGRWDMVHPNLPSRMGKINHIDKFDASFFGYHSKQANAANPMVRMILEKTYEAIVDAGVNPVDLRGSRTGVFVGASSTEATRELDKNTTPSLSICSYLGRNRATYANRISYWLQCNGPSILIDSACSSSLYALENAYRAIRDGDCDQAIVAGYNLCRHPAVTLEFSLMGVLSMDGMCKTFDNNARGYVRSETASAIFLQKAKDSKRIYSTVVYAKTNCDGYKEQGITFPSTKMQQELLRDFYKECQVEPTSVAWVEAHGTGTKVGDPEECNALSAVFCKGRNSPLPIGSVKSNMGHTEPGSGLCSIAKVIIAMETGLIPPNLHYSVPREGVPGLVDGSLQVVTEPQPWDGGLVGVNSFGFGGANCHVLLRWNPKKKVNGGIPGDNIPRLVTVSSRTELGVNQILDDLESRPLDAEYVRLYHEIPSIQPHGFRGYTILQKANRPIRDVQCYSKTSRSLWFIFSGFDSQWSTASKSLQTIPSFARAITRCHQALLPTGVDLLKIVTDNMMTDPVHNCIGITAVQIGLVFVLKTIGVKPDGLIGYSFGELVAAYADDSLTLEQTILAAYYYGLTLNELKSQKGAMARIDIGFEAAKALLLQDVEVACHDTVNSCVICGTSQKVASALVTLKAKGVTGKNISSHNLALHSRHVANAEIRLLQKLQKVIPTPKTRSASWISSSVADSQLTTKSSAEYFSHNLVSPVLFEDALNHVPSNSILIEFSPNGNMSDLLSSVGNHSTYVALADKEKDGIEYLLGALGKLYTYGVDLDLAKMYPEVSFPVSRGTPMISPLIGWNHIQSWHVDRPCKTNDSTFSGEQLFMIDVTTKAYDYNTGHVIDGRNLFPATGYLTLVWTAFKDGFAWKETPVVFENVRFVRATILPKIGVVNFVVAINKVSGNFEVVEGGVAIVTGRVYAPDDVSKELAELPTPKPSSLKEMSSRDIYKELHLRGYNYSGLFKSLVSSDNNGVCGKIRWMNNYVAFMDNMLQMQILSVKARHLYVPTFIDKLVIDPVKHNNIVSAMEAKGEECVLDVTIHQEVGIIKAGGIEIRGLSASSITRKKPAGDPVLEKYQFVPNTIEGPLKGTTLDLQAALRVCVHVALENQFSVDIKCVELADEEANAEKPLLAPTLAEVFGDLPLLRPAIKVLSKRNNPLVADLEAGILVEDNNLSSNPGCQIVIGTNILNRQKVFQSALGCVGFTGYIISRERADQATMQLPGVHIVNEYTVNDEKIVLIKKSVIEIESKKVIRIEEGNHNWIPKLQSALRSGKSNQRVLLVAQREPLNGILGLFNCIRKESGGDYARCFFILDKDVPDFDPELPFYKNQVDKDVALNVYKDGCWGSYRHLKIEGEPLVESYQASVDVMTRGDLSSFKWFENSLDPRTNELNCEQELVYVYNSALNFRDVMMVSGKLAASAITRGIKKSAETCPGFEFSGRDSKGQRVMGLVSFQHVNGMGETSGLSTIAIGDRGFMWKVPDHWSLEDAATVPVVYATSYYALFTSGRIQKGDTVLIHAGSGGVGQSAINIALHEGCTVFTTVGTQAKRDFIKQQFPQIPDSHIGNSRDTSFEQMVMRETNGRGVDIVLNSLAEEKLQASLRCLATGGRFLEIGKFDLASNNTLGMEVFLRETSFHGVMLDNMFSCSGQAKKPIVDMVAKGIQEGAVKPLTRTVFKDDEIEQAFRFMAAGKHIGKVLVQIRPEESTKVMIPELLPKKDVTPRFFCNYKKTYVVLGGLGGFGLELADWLVERGARNLILSSRRGLTTGYQTSRVSYWKTLGVTVIINTADISTENGVTALLQEANSLGPVAAIFNLAVVLVDALFENQTEENFIKSASSKSEATKHFDTISRKLCPELKHFVVFSSVSCGRGNAGQTNYGMTNSVMERICEKRVMEGLPGLAVQWGAVGDVGLVVEMQQEQHELVIGGTLQQRILSCLFELDRFLLQPHPVVASMVVAEKKAGEATGNIIDYVLNILGLKDIKTVSMQSTLADLGMDSMMAVEIKQVLEREFEIILPPQELRALTFFKMMELSNESKEEKKADNVISSSEDINEEGFQFMVRAIGDEESASKSIIELPSLFDLNTTQHMDTDTMFMIPGIEGMATVLEPLAKRLRCRTIGLQLEFMNNAVITSLEMARSLLPHIRPSLSHSTPFNLLGYSFGGLITLDLVMLLEAEGYRGHVFLLDSSPDFLKGLCKGYQSEDAKEENVQIFILINILNLIKKQSSNVIDNIRLALSKLDSWDERVDYFMTLVPESHHSPEYIKCCTRASYQRMLSILNHSWRHETKLQSSVTLVRPSYISLQTDKDYGLSKYCNQKVEVHFVEGDHVSILESPELADIINQQKLTEKHEDK